MWEAAIGKRVDKQGERGNPREVSSTHARTSSRHVSCSPSSAQIRHMGSRSRMRAHFEQ